MSGTEPPVRDDELHAFVDGELAADRRAAIAAWLAQNPGAAERVRAWQSQREALRAAFTAATPPAPEFSLLEIVESRMHRRRRVWTAAAAAGLVIALGLGGLAGWMLHGVPQDGNAALLASLEQEAFATHIVYSADRRHPIEVAAAERDHLAQWLSNRLDRKVAPPDLSQAGWHLLGGRLLATDRGGTAALFMYDNDQKQRLSVVMRPVPADIPMTEPQRVGGPLHGCAWISRGVGFAVVGPAAQDEISAVAKLVKQQSSA